jgi:hypothetical protein
MRLDLLLDFAHGLATRRGSLKTASGFAPIPGNRGCCVRGPVDPTELLSAKRQEHDHRTCRPAHRDL